MNKRTFLIIAVSALFISSCSHNKIVINTASDLSGHKIGVQIGTTGENYVKTNIPNAKVFSYKNVTDAFENLKQNQVEAIVIDEYPAIQIVSKNPEFMLVRDKLFEENKEEYAIAVKKGNTELLNSINETISELKQNGKYDGLLRSFISPEGVKNIPEVINSPANKTLRLGTDAQFAPFEYITEKEYEGFDITLSEYIAQKENARLQIKDLAFTHLIDALKADEIDFIASAMSITPEREKEVDFSVPYFSSELVILIKK